MPYTPPSQQSPAASQSSSPPLSRSHSYLVGQTLAPARPDRPLSSSYLSRHRRSPSISKNEDTTQSPAMNLGLTATVGDDERKKRKKVDPHGSLRQSPPPVNQLLIPTGATISPPESSHSSSDEEPSRGRAWDLENLAALQAMVRTIPQRKSGSPTRRAEEARQTMALDLVVPYLDKTLQVPSNTPADPPGPPLSREARKISHSRSSTDPNSVLDLARPTPSTGQAQHDSDDDSDGSLDRAKPPMVRKKSGELVRPALRPSSANRRPSSMPGTPTYKAVHFDSHLEHVRHFLQVDRPLAVSAGSSPVENYDGESEFLPGQDPARSASPPFEWEIRLANFPSDTRARQSWPVRVERVFLSSDNKNIIGIIAVQNLSFQKTVVVRFTLDYWKTTSEVLADYNHDIRQRQNDGCDRFNFSVSLADLANLENKTMFFCVRYHVIGQEYWDNNNFMNYQVDFTKRPKPQLGQDGPVGSASRPLTSLPRSRPLPPVSSGSRPKTAPASFDDFASGFDSFDSFGKSPAAIMGETPIKLKSPRPRHEIVPDAPARRTKANAQALGHRYNFGASLNAAIQNASNILGGQSGLPPRVDAMQSFHQVPASSSSEAVFPKSYPVGEAVIAPEISRPAALLSGKPSLSSQSYKELVDKYCFVGTRSRTEV